MHSSRGGLSLPSDPGADLGSYHNEDQENTPNEGRAPQQPAVKSAARIAPVYEEPPLPDYPAMFPEEDSGRGESRNEFPERGGEAAYDDPTREIAPRLPPPIISRSHSVASQGSLVNSNSVASSSSPSEFDPSKLYLENLPLPISETRLRDLFQQFGTIKRVHIGTDRATKAQLGFGFVDFATDQQGLAAIAAMNQRDVDGRIIRCSQAKRRSTPNAAQSAMVSPAAAARSMGGAAQPGYGGMPGAADQSGGISQQPYVMMMNSAMMGGMGMMSPQQMQMAGAGMMMGGGAMQPMGMGMQPMGYGVGAGGMINSATGMMMMAPGGAAAPAAAALPTATPAPAQPFYGRNDAPPSPNIFINGVPFAYTEADLQTLFEPFGAILSTKILLDMQGKSRGQGFINFKEQASAQASIQAWNAKKPPNGETYLQVRYALPRKGVVGAVGAVAPAASSAAQQQPQMQPMMMMGAGGMPEQQQAQFDPSQQQMMMAGSDLPPGLCGQLPFAPSRVAGSLGVGAGSDSGYGPDRKGRAHLGQKHDPLSRPTPSTAATGASNLSSVYGAPAVAAGAASLAGVPNGPDSTTLFIYHVPQKLTNEELQALFAQHGAVHSVSIPRDANNQGKGFAFAKMATMADAHNAMNALQGHEIQGKRLKVSFKTEKRDANAAQAAGAANNNTAVLLAQAQAQAAQAQQQVAAVAQQQQMMILNPMMMGGGMGGGMLFNPLMMMAGGGGGGGGGMTPQQHMQLLMQQQQLLMQQMGQMQQPAVGVGVGGAMQPTMQFGMMHAGGGGGQHAHPGGALLPNPLARVDSGATQTMQGGYSPRQQGQQYPSQ